MKITLYTADCKGNPKNCTYPNKEVVTNKEELIRAVEKDQVFATYKNNYRNINNFLESDVIPMDCDNDHSERAEDWYSASKLEDVFADIDHIILPSRNHLLKKGEKAARPRYHILFPIVTCTDSVMYSAIKTSIQEKYEFFDDNALDAARFFFGVDCKTEDIVWHEGFLSIDETLEETDCVEEKCEKQVAVYGTIQEGSRNNTMSHYAGRVLKKYGITDKAYELYKERSTKCEPPLPTDELDNIWKSAVRFAKRIQEQEGYIPPEEFNNEFGTCAMKPEDYSDIGEAKVLATECSNKLRFTSATDYITFDGERWYEDKEKSLGTVEEFMDNQLLDAIEAVKIAEENLIVAGILEADVKARGKTLEKAIPKSMSSMLVALTSADVYKKFVMKYRNYKKLTDVQNAAKPMLAIDVSELDYDAELLNTPDLTYDLSKGLGSGYSHDPDDLITKVTGCSPGKKGKQLWEDTLATFFCNDIELINYVQQIVGMAAVGRVYAEQMIIAYGGGANGKSTFWNTIARVLGNYSGKISADALTMNCKRNVKPEMAELKGKRLIIASELEEGTRLNTGMVKQICSVDPIEAEKKYKSPFHFEPSHTLVLYTNHLPKVSANDDGTWRRLIVIPFQAKITGKSDIKNYSDYIFDNAGPAILTWIIEGAKIAIEKGFKIQEPKAVLDAINAYREDNDWLGQFIDEHCDVDINYEERSSDLYQQYRSVCIQTGEYVRSTSDFYGSLERAGFKKQRRNKGRMIVGLRLKEGQDFLE